MCCWMSRSSPIVQPYGLHNQILNLESTRSLLHWASSGFRRNQGPQSYRRFPLLNLMWVRVYSFAYLASSSSTRLLSPKYSSTAVKYGPCLLTRIKESGFRKQVHEETSPYLLLGVQDPRLGAEQDQLLRGSTGNSSGNCQETETCMVRIRRTPWQPPKTHPSGHLGEWATPWSAEEMLDGQHQKVDIHAHARTAHKDLLQKSLEADLSWTASPPDESIDRGTEVSEWFSPHC